MVLQLCVFWFVQGFREWLQLLLFLFVLESMLLLSLFCVVGAAGLAAVFALLVLLL